MGFKNIGIALDNMPSCGYQPGSTINGRVIISANQSIHIRSLMIKVYGEAKVSFTDTVRRTDIRTYNRSDNFGSRTSVSEESRLETFSAYERYISTSYTVLGETYIQPGEQEFVFSVILSSILPSTFNGRHGSIRYWIMVKMDKAWNFDQVVKTEFIVCAPKDLRNESSSLAVPKVYRDFKHFNFLCCSSGPLTLTVDLPKSGVVPGETLQLTIELDNATNVLITSVKILLKQEVKWIANSPSSNSTTTNNTLLTVHCPGVAKRDSISWRQPITIPDITSINIDECSIIKQKHYIVVEAVPEGMHLNLVVTANIVIGTTPIGRGYETQRTYDPPPGLGIVQPQPPGVGFVQPQPPGVGFVQPSNIGYNQPQPPGVGFADPRNAMPTHPQPSAPLTPDFVQPEPPPPYPTTPDSYQPPQLHKKNF